MDPMIIGQVMYRTASYPHSVYSPWMPREGNAATFSVETISTTDASSYNFTIQHKNLADADSAATDLVSATAFTSGVKSVNGSGAKELVRYQVTTVDAVNSDMLTFRYLPPQWETN